MTRQLLHSVDVSLRTLLLHHTAGSIGLNLDDVTPQSLSEGGQPGASSQLPSRLTMGCHVRLQ